MVLTMKYGVSGNTLLITAGLVWLIAGINVLRIGISYWVDSKQYWLLKLGETALVFLFFFGIIFHRLYHKHTRRIAQKPNNNCPFSFFDIKGWIIMSVMITFGILARTYHWLPAEFIAFFYTGLSLALIATGLRFIKRWWKGYSDRVL